MNRNIAHENLVKEIVKEIPKHYQDFIVLTFDSGSARAMHDPDRVIKYGVDGYPDITVLAPCSTWFGFEVKTGKATQSKTQRIFQERCKDINGKYFIARSVSDVMNPLNEFMGIV